MKFIKKRKERALKKRADELREMKKRVFVNRLKTGDAPRRRPMMKVMGNVGTQGKER